ncbi:MAG: hypothetical protein WC548_00350 [Candidatus Pacearchaeota archaeon]
MKRNLLFVPFVAVLTLFVVGASAAELANSDFETTFNGVELSDDVLFAGMVGDSVPVRVTFNALEDSSNVRVRIRMEGIREDISASTERFDIISGVTYTKSLTLELPSDLADTDKEYTLYVEIVSADGRTERMYSIVMQRESYEVEILAVDYNSRVAGNEVVPVSVVVKNSGFNRLDDVFVLVSIPELGIMSRGYLGDLIPVEDYSDDYEDEEDSVSKTVYFRAPENVKSGIYEMEIIVYNDDFETSVKRLISVGEDGVVNVIAAVKNKDLKAGETVTYDLIIVNSADNVRVFNLEEISGNDLTVVVPSVITVGPKSSETVSISVTADENAEVGTRTFSVEVDGESVVFGANVVEDGYSTSVVALTVILVIVFIVLLAVLIILLTRKEKPMEEVETSYY